MQASQIPAKFPIPFASAAGPDFTHQLPVASQIGITDGAASLTDGFPPLNFVPVAAGGIPPFGRDMNGIIRQATAWARWQAAGVAAAFDASFATAIGGYPAGSLVLLDSGQTIVKSSIDNNMTNPNVSLGSVWDTVSNVWASHIWQAGGSANAQTITISAHVPPTTLNQLKGSPIRFFSVGNNTTAPSLNPNGLGVIPIVALNGSPLAAGSLLTGEMYEVLYDGTNFVMHTAIAVFPDTASLNGAITIDGSSSTNGGAIRMIGNGGTTPRKWLRVLAGFLQIINDAFSAAILNLSDTGDLETAGDITATGDVVASGGRLRATLPARGSGDGNAAVLLDDFSSLDSGGNLVTRGALTSNGNITAITGNVVAQAGKLRAAVGAFGSGDASAATLLGDFQHDDAGGLNTSAWWRISPDGYIEQGLFFTINTGISQSVFSFPIAFQRSVYSVVAVAGSLLVTVSPFTDNLIGADAISLSQFEISDANVAGTTHGVFLIATGY